MTDAPLLLTLLRFTGFAFAGIFLWFVGRAWIRHRVPSMAILFVAIGLLAVGTIIEGGMLVVFDATPDQAHTVEAVFQLVAFVVLVWSVLAHKVE